MRQRIATASKTRWRPISRRICRLRITGLPKRNCKPRLNWSRRYPSHRRSRRPTCVWCKSGRVTHGSTCSPAAVPMLPAPERLARYALARLRKRGAAPAGSTSISTAERRIEILLNFARFTPCTPPAGHVKHPLNGQVAEWSKAHAWKVCRRETVSRVRIPVSPPDVKLNPSSIF